MSSPPYLAKLTALKSLDLSHSMLGDVGHGLPALAELEELKLGATPDHRPIKPQLPQAPSKLQE